MYINNKHQELAPGLRGWFGMERATITQQLPKFKPEKKGLKRF